MKTRQEIKELGKQGMAYQRGPAILTLLVFILIYIGGGLFSFIPILGSLIVMGTLFFVDMPLMVGMSGSYVKIYNKEHTDVGHMFSCFSINYMRKVGGMAWMYLWIFLWSLISVPIIIIAGVTGGYAAFAAGGAGGGAVGAGVFFLFLLMMAAFVPAIIKTISYSMTAYILEHFPSVNAREALNISMRMTQGHKLDIFVFCLSFIGWFLLSALTLGILYIVYVGPYFYTSFSGLYQELRDNALAEGRVTREELGMDAPQPVQEPVVIS